MTGRKPASKTTIEPQAAAAVKTGKAVKGVTQGFNIHEETLGLLDPVERLVADELIRNGTWILVPKNTQ